MACGHDLCSEELSSAKGDLTSVTRAINGIREKNASPDATSIHQYLRKQGLSIEEIEVSSALKNFLQDGLIGNKPYRGEDSFHVSAKANAESVLKRSVDQSEQHEINMKDYLDGEIGKIWLVLEMLCREGRSNHKSVSEASLVTFVCDLEDQIKLLQTKNKSLSTANEMLQNELNRVSSCKDTAFCSQDGNDCFVVPNPRPRNRADCNPLQ